MMGIRAVFWNIEILLELIKESAGYFDCPNNCDVVKIKNNQIIVKITNFALICNILIY
tara:strand:- start:6078 stop:6251 length:174 start_codon:yes stop_codon:yes gene_type:complete